ncbi:DUF397 domain-containing protein [Kitasatospora sp. NPDC048365]|uniref:DUF397 domain-containing protein n=1 Tax=Kitasatospora sp. NPDC048365 TaxID=3364050 RepID=UPI00371435BD
MTSAYLIASDLPVAWRKSTDSNPNDDCVECGALADGVIVTRDSKDPHGPALVFAGPKFSAFTTAVGSDTLVPVVG